MTSSIYNKRALEAIYERLSHLDTCASEAPEGCYDHVKEVSALISETVETFMREARALGLKAPGDDTAHHLALALYDYIVQDEDNELGLATGEGFGKAMTAYGPETARRVMARTIADRDFLHRACPLLALARKES